ncbi:hypothetical protein K493DRAFT_406578 [Basidiobolus meristosporus CBS 931.73]|uniref:SRR1-like domain-containing protein n=1 Tax=Basidiobolus meristosporus CBS 931.73 TaxID=1314790 RepID=A0A1Y1YLM1_9FUNG|nr:hypothetical protein K493DRAFT_406578 [Basidiobolus meristosporus CBS 931.73]|eukprot:ORX98484.1 hypothetical protein K493DRAFT_406578 [Basidiobolus meristosporus CBS 931.73]
MEENGFTLFKYNTRKSRNRRRQRNEPPKVSTETVVEYVEDKIDTLKHSDFYAQLKEIIVPSQLPEFEDIICYGVGSFEQSRTSQFQLGLILLLRELLQFKGKLHSYDPVLTEIDLEVLQHYGIELIKTNEQAKRSVSGPTLFYMPHCGKTLYNNLLASNWSRKAVANVYLIGNRLEMYHENEPTSKLRREVPHIVEALDLIKCSPFPEEFDNNTIFNDICIHQFLAEKVNAAEDSVFEVEVTSEPENDPEVV